MEKKELDEILRPHSLWRSGAVGVRADLRDANLHGAYLQDADLRDADLRGADLQDAYLQDAYLQDAYLRGANLRGANLRGANLRDADLRGADLQRANLRWVYLEGSDLRDASLRDANLREANLWGAKLPDFQLCPASGVSTGYKKVSAGFVLKLEIDASEGCTSSLVGRKCRARKVRVVGWMDASVGGEVWQTSPKSFTSSYDGCFTYDMGEVSEVVDWSDDIRRECVPGIHFFMTLSEARDW